MTNIIQFNNLDNFNKNKLNFNEENNLNLNKYPEPSELIISTCTVVSSIENELDLNLFSRCLPIHDINNDIMENKEGGIYNITLLSDYSRGNLTFEKKGKIKEFNNQVTINYKYWGFRTANIKIFTNGKLQMTGIKYEKEAKIITEMIINYIKNMKIKIYLDKKFIDNDNNNDINNLNNMNSSIKKTGMEKTGMEKTGNKNCDKKVINKQNSNNDTNEISESKYNNTFNTSNNDKFESSIYWVYNYHKNEIYYMRKNNIYIQKLIEFNNLNYSEDYKFINAEIKSLIAATEKKLINLKSKKNIINEILKDIEFCLTDNPRKKILLEDEDIKLDQFNIDDLVSQNIMIQNNKMDDNLTLDIILLVINNQKPEVVIEKIDIILKFVVDYINKIYQNINIKISKNINYKNNQDYLNLYKNILDKISNIELQINKNIKKINIVKNEDVNCTSKLNLKLSNNIKKYIQEEVQTNTNINKNNNYTDIVNDIKYINYNYLSDLENNKPSYKLGDIKTELINSDYYTKFNIDLTNLSNILKKKYNIYNNFDRDEYPGVLARFYYNDNNKVQGQCNCETHCSIVEKKSICCKITISIFRPGSIIITGAKNITQLKYTYNFINKVLKDNYELIKGVNDDEIKINNNIRKISRKPRLFYLKKSNIIKT